MEPVGEFRVPVCPVCGCRDFVDANRRFRVMCGGCKSLERTRLVWLVIERFMKVHNVRNVVHFAPELGIARKLAERCGEGYRAFDFEPDRYRFDFVEVRKLDLCHPIMEVKPGSQDLVLHNHVLEHLPCDPWLALHRIDGLLAVGGMHLFSVPVMGERYDEDMDPKMPASVRAARFGQDDHMRVFGRQDVEAMLAERAGALAFRRVVDFTAEELEAAAIPVSVLHSVSSHSVFARIRA